ncbi:MAG: hypothetical protein U1F43_26740 [Myxococcota bacterium]
MMYQLQAQNETQEFPKRADAIAAAKAMSLELKQAVVVVDPLQRERMTYQGGELESYTYETRAGKTDR